MKINIQLKESDLEYCYATFEGQSVADFEATAFEIHDAVKNNNAGDVPLTVSVDTDQIKRIYEMSARLSEGYVSDTNNNIKDALVPQLIIVAENYVIVNGQPTFPNFTALRTGTMTPEEYFTASIETNEGKPVTKLILNILEIDRSNKQMKLDNIQRVHVKLKA